MIKSNLSNSCYKCPKPTLSVSLEEINGTTGESVWSVRCIKSECCLNRNNNPITDSLKVIKNICTATEDCKRCPIDKVCTTNFKESPSDWKIE